MNEQRKQIIVLAVFGVVLLGVIIFQVVRMREPAPTTQPATARPAPTAQTAPAQARPAGTPSRPAASGDYRPMDPDALQLLISRIQRVTFRYPDTPGRDPMVPLVRPQVMLGRPGSPGFTPEAGYLNPTAKVVSGVIGNPDAPFAIVDNETVYPGYVFPDGVRVEEIDLTRKMVIFRYEDKLFPVPIKE